MDNNIPPKPNDAFVKNRGGSVNLKNYEEVVFLRYNELVSKDEAISGDIIYRQKNLDLIKMLIDDSFDELRDDLERTSQLLDKVIKKKRSLGNEFLQLLKSDTFSGLKDKTDLLEYENYLSSEEFLRLLDRKGL